MQSSKKIVRAVLAALKKYIFGTKLKSPPLEKYTHTHRKGGYEISSYASLHSAKEISHYMFIHFVVDEINKIIQCAIVSH